MKSMWNDADRAALLERIARVEASTPSRWGKLNASEMLAHITESMKMALGDVHAKPKRLPIRFFPLKQLVIYLLPFPKGAPTAPELLTGDASSTDASKAELRRLLGAFAAHAGAFPEHPAFGRVSRRGWGVLTYRHLDHHLRQFGV